MCVVVSCSSGCVDHTNELKEPDMDDLLAMVAREGYYGHNYTWVFVFQNGSSYCVTTSGVGGAVTSPLDKHERGIADTLLAAVNYTYNNTPVSIKFMKLNDTTYTGLHDHALSIIFTVNRPPSVIGLDVGYYQVQIYPEGFAKSTRYYCGAHPNNATQQFALDVLALWGSQ